MSRYRIVYKIKTVAELVHPFEFGGYNFLQYSQEFWEDDCWVADRTVEATNFAEAFNQFKLDLIPIIEQCSSVSQCAFQIFGGSYLIYRLDNNPDKVVYIFLVKTYGHVGLLFDKQEIDQLQNTSKVANKNGFMYIMDATNCTTYYSRLSMLMSAVEAFAGEEDKAKIRRTNKTEMIAILGKELYDKLYLYGVGLRHKLVHGNISDHNEFAGLTDEIYSKIRDYLSSKYDIEINSKVVDPLRNFSDGGQFTRLFYKFRSEPVFELKSIEDELLERLDATDKSKGLIFAEYTPGVKNY